MKTTRQRLERILRVRQSELDLAAVAVAHAGVELDGARSEVKATRNAIEDSSRETERRAATGLCAGEYWIRSLAIESTRDAERSAVEREHESRDRFDRAHRNLLEVRTRVRGLERLHERRGRAEAVEQERVARSALDEVGLRAASRREVGSR